MSEKSLKTVTNEKYFSSLVNEFSQALVTGKFCDVKVVCEDSSLWAHRVILGTVSPFLKSLLDDCEARGEDVLTIHLPLIKSYHMKLVLDYIYSGAMYLAGTHMQYVIQVMEVLQLKCGVSVNKMVLNGSESNKKWIEVEHSTMKLKSSGSPRAKSKEESVCSISPAGPKEPLLSPPPKEPLPSPPIDGQKESIPSALKEAIPSTVSSPAKAADAMTDEVEAKASSSTSTDAEDHKAVGEQVGLLATAEESTSSGTAKEAGDKDVTKETSEEIETEGDGAADRKADADADPDKEAGLTAADDDAKEGGSDDDDSDSDSSSSSDSSDDSDSSSDNEDVDEVAEADEETTEKGKDDDDDDDENEADVVETIDIASDKDDDEDKDDADDADTSFDQDPDADTGNDVVMVEIDEEFLVEPVNETTEEGDVQAKHKCALCHRVFRYYQNLQVHLTGHLGVKVNINRCRPCKRNFKNKLELDLHLKSHSYARHLGKYRLVKSKEETNAMVNTRIVTTSGTRERKIVRKYVKQDLPVRGLKTRSTAKVDIQRDNDDGVSSAPRLAAHEPAAVWTTPSAAPSRGMERISFSDIPRSSSTSRLTCQMCEKSFGVRSLYIRHMRQKHPGVLVQEDGGTSSVQPSPIAASRSSSRSAQAPTTPAADSATPRRKRGRSSRSETSPDSVQEPAAKKPAREVSSTPDRGSLKCPDCDRVFPAKSIFQRHLKTAKHGSYAVNESSPIVEPFTPTFTNNRHCECHLCGMTFMRIRDLAKHREKVCSAWQTPT